MQNIFCGNPLLTGPLLTRMCGSGQALCSSLLLGCACRFQANWTVVYYRGWGPNTLWFCNALSMVQDKNYGSATSETPWRSPELEWWLFSVFLWYFLQQLCDFIFLSFLNSTIRISRKGWHMLINFCFHTALTFAVFAGGINRVKYPIVCQGVSGCMTISIFILKWNEKCKMCILDYLGDLHSSRGNL